MDTPKKKPRGRPFQRGSDARRDIRWNSDGSLFTTPATPSENAPMIVTETAPKVAAPIHPDAPVPDALRTPVADFAGSLAHLLQSAASSSCNEDRVRAIVAEAVAQIETPARRVVIEQKGRAPIDLGTTVHPAVEEVLTLAAAGLNNVLLVGPAGCGKTEIARTVAKALALPFGALTFSAGVPEWHLTGRAIPNTSEGRNVYEPSQSVTLYETGGVILWDEIDAADPNMLLTVNTALANGHWPLAARADRPDAQRHDDALCIAAANTYGQGATRIYAGRNQLDAATLDRFACAIIDVTYDKALERALVSRYLDTKQATAVLERIWHIRARVESLGLRRVVSMRASVHAAKLVAAGQTLDSVVSRFLNGWTADERSKVAA